MRSAESAANNNKSENTLFKDVGHLLMIAGKNKIRCSCAITSINKGWGDFSPQHLQCHKHLVDFLIELHGCPGKSKGPAQWQCYSSQRYQSIRFKALPGLKKRANCISNLWAETQCTLWSLVLLWGLQYICKKVCLIITNPDQNKQKGQVKCSTLLFAWRKGFSNYFFLLLFVFFLLEAFLLLARPKTLPSLANALLL